MKALILVLALLPASAWAALVDPALHGFARSSGGVAKVLVLMEFKPTRQLPARADANGIRQYLKTETQYAWNRTAPSLQAVLAKGDVRLSALHSINQSFSAVVTPAGLLALAKAPGLTKIYANGGISVIRPVERRPVPARRFESMPYDIVAMGLDRLLQSHPHLTGQGVLVGHIDTGVDGSHLALAGKVAIFYDSGRGQRTQPTDEGDHGTHTAGTILGAPRDGVPMGVAPGARLVAAAGLTSYDDMLRAMEFMLDPDGRPETNDVPRLVSNSWNCNGAPDLEAFYRAITTWEAAGIMTVFSAGNAGPRPQSITRPHEHPFSFSVGATGQSGLIADFSSRGPGVFNGQHTAKPDVSAPGVNIVSAVPGGRYEAMSGTSMAAPHAAGLAALLYQLHPGLTPTQMRDILTQSSNYVDERGQDIPQMKWNANYGFGRLNAVKAVAMVENLLGRFDRRWSSLMTPSVGLMDGFAKISSLDYGVEAPKLATELLTKFPTDESRWIPGDAL